MKRNKIFAGILTGIISLSIIFSIPLTSFAASAPGGRVSYKTAIATAQKKYPSSKITQFELEYENRKYEYEMEFVDANRQKYDITVDAATGKILRINRDGKLHSTLKLDQLKVGYNTAVETARKQIGSGALKDFEIDWRGKMPFYEIEFTLSGGKTNKTVVNATNGRIVSTTGRGIISQADASKIAIKATGNGTVISIYLDEDDGREYYKIKVRALNGLIYEIEVDAKTGNVIEIDLDD